MSTSESPIAQLRTNSPRHPHAIALQLVAWAEEGGSAAAVARAAAHYATSRSRARDLLRIGRAMAKLPTLDEALASGEIGWTKARLVIRVATPDSIDLWLERAKTLSRRELAPLVRSAVASAAAAERGGWTVRIAAEDRAIVEEAHATLRAEMRAEMREDPDLGAAIGHFARWYMQGAAQRAALLRAPGPIWSRALGALVRTLRRGTTAKV